MAEIGLMLMSWGVPPTDVKLVMEVFDKDGSGDLSFEEFFKNFKIVYHLVSYTHLTLPTMVQV